MRAQFLSPQIISVLYETMLIDQSALQGAADIPSQAFTMLLLASESDGAIPIRAASQMLGLAPARAKAIAESLVGDDLAFWDRSALDRRSLSLQASSKGNSLRPIAIASLEGALQDRWRFNREVQLSDMIEAIGGFAQVVPGMWIGSDSAFQCALLQLQKEYRTHAHLNGLTFLQMNLLIVLDDRESSQLLAIRQTSPYKALYLQALASLGRDRLVEISEGKSGTQILLTDKGGRRLRSIISTTENAPTKAGKLTTPSEQSNEFGRHLNTLLEACVAAGNSLRKTLKEPMQ